MINIVPIQLRSNFTIQFWKNSCSLGGNSIWKYIKCGFVVFTMVLLLVKVSCSYVFFIFQKFSGVWVFILSPVKSAKLEQGTEFFLQRSWQKPQRCHQTTGGVPEHMEFGLGHSTVTSFLVRITPEMGWIDWNFKLWNNRGFHSLKDGHPWVHTTWNPRCS